MPLPEIPSALWTAFQQTLFSEQADNVESAEAFRWGAGDAIASLSMYPDDGTNWVAEEQELLAEQQRRQAEEQRLIEEQARRDQEDWQRVAEERAAAARANELARLNQQDPNAQSDAPMFASFDDTANTLMQGAFGQDEPQEPLVVSFDDTANGLMQSAFGPEDPGEGGSVAGSGWTPEEPPPQPYGPPLSEAGPEEPPGFLEQAGEFLSRPRDEEVRTAVDQVGRTLQEEGIVRPIARPISNAIRSAQGREALTPETEPVGTFDQAVMKTAKKLPADVEMTREGWEEGDYGKAAIGALGVVDDFAPTTLLGRQLNEMLPKADTPFGEVGFGDAAMAAAGLKAGVDIARATPKAVRAVGRVSGEAVDAVRALLRSGVSDDAVLAAERSLAEAADVPLSAVKELTRRADDVVDDAPAVAPPVRSPEVEATGSPSLVTPERPTPGERIRLPDGTRAVVEEAPRSFDDVSRAMDSPAQRAAREEASRPVIRPDDNQFIREEFGRPWEEVAPAHPGSADRLGPPTRQIVTEGQGFRPGRNQAYPEDIKDLNQRHSVNTDSLSANATPGITPGGVSLASRALADVSNSLGGGVAGAAGGMAMPADSEEERRQNALLGAGIGMVAGPAAGRLMRRGGGALATPGITPSAGDVAAEAARGPVRGKMLNRKLEAPGSAVPLGVRIAKETTDPLAGLRWAEDMLLDAAGVTKKVGENDPRRAATAARINASGIAAHRIERELEPLLLDSAHANLQHELVQFVEDMHQKDILDHFFTQGRDDAIAMFTKRIDDAVAAGKVTPAQEARARAAIAAKADAAGMAKMRKREGGSTDMVYEKIAARLAGTEQRLTKSGQWDTLQDLAQRVWDSNARNLKRAHEADEISDEAYALLSDRYKHYVPTVPISHLDPTGMTSGRGVPSSGNTVTRGSTPLVRSLDDMQTEGERLNPIVATRNAIIRTEKAAAKNIIARRFAELVDDAVVSGGLTPPTTGEVRRLWEGTEPIHFFIKGEPQTIYVPKIVADGIDASSNAGMDEFSSLYKRLVRTVTQNITGKRGAFIFVNLARDASDYAVRRMAVEGGPHNLPGIMTTWADEAGKAFVDIARAQANVRGATGAVVGGTLGAASGDADTTMQERIRNAGFGAVTGMFLLGAKKVRSTGKAAEYVERGGGMGGIRGDWKSGVNWHQEVLRDGGAPIRSVGDFGNFIKQWAKEVATFEGVGGINNRTELISRTAAMRRSEARGASPVEAMIAGRDASIDFDRYGTMVRAINSYVPFFGAITQGSAQFARLFRDHPVVASTSILATLGPVMLTAESWNRSDPARARAYDDVPQYVKDSGLVVMMPWAGTDQRGSKPNYFWYPLQIVSPFLIAGREAMKNLPGHEPTAGRSDQDPESGEAMKWLNIFGTAVGMFSPIKGDSPTAAVSSLMPPVVKQIAELGANQDFFRGTAIATDFNDERASAIGRSVSGGIQDIGRNTGAAFLQNVRPSHIDYLMRQLPAYGDVAVGASDAIAPSPAKQAEDRPIQNAPGVGGIAGRFIRDTGGANLERARGAAWSSRVEAAIRDASLRPSALQLTTPSTYDDMPLTRDEQILAQQAFNRHLDTEIARMQSHRYWQTPARREEMVKDAIAAAKERAKFDTMRSIPAGVRRQRAMTAASMTAGR